MTSYNVTPVSGGGFNVTPDTGDGGCGILILVLLILIYHAVKIAVLWVIAHWVIVLLAVIVISIILILWNHFRN